MCHNLTFRSSVCIQRPVHQTDRGWEIKHCRSRTTSSPAEAALVQAACCQLEAAGWCLYSPQGRINPELCSRLHWENDKPQYRPQQTALLFLKNHLWLVYQIALWAEIISLHAGCPAAVLWAETARLSCTNDCLPVWLTSPDLSWQHHTLS